MPIYEYACAQCGHSDSELDSISAPRVKKCPQCGRRSFKRLISAAAFHLKGGGWYETDFKDKPKDSGKADSEKPDNAKNDSAKGDSEKSGAAKSDSDKSGAEKKSDGGKESDSGGEKDYAKSAAAKTSAKDGSSKPRKK